MKTKEFLTVRATALRLGVTIKHVRDLLYEERLAGAHKHQGIWQIPISAVNERLKAREERNGRQ